MINWDDETPDQPKTVATSPTSAPSAPASSGLNLPSPSVVPGAPQQTAPTQDIWANLGDFIKGAVAGDQGAQTKALGGVAGNIGGVLEPVKTLFGDPVGAFKGAEAIL